MQNPQDILQHVFGYHDFRGQQERIVNAVIEGQDALVLMPTGGGKSLCYQIPALARSGTGIVISPLIALMQDQVTALRELGVRAGFLNSTLAWPDVVDTERALLDGELDLLYIAPERLIQPRTLDLLHQANIALFAIDEAHCVAQWGHDFRADYLRLDLLHNEFPQVPRIALTATADMRTREEIIERLQLEEARQFIVGFDRPNIQYRVQQKDNPRRQLLGFLKDEYPQQSGIVYCLSRKKVEQTAEWLQKEGFNALPYHAGLPGNLRETHQSRFLREDGIIMVATIAFGMGIDKPDVRFVAHLDLPKSIEAYYQETGRAGRDGQPATALLLYGLEDVVKLRQMMGASEGNDQFKRQEQQRLSAMLGLCEVTSCRRQILLRYFGDTLDEPCGNCDTCLTPPQTWDATEAVQKALSCVYRTGQRFGATHIVDVLRGSSNEKVLAQGHDKLSTYGIGQDMSADEWRAVLRQLVAAGYLDVDPEGFGGLQLTESCRPILRGEQRVHLRRDIRTRKPTSTRTARRPDADITEADRPLWEALRACRRRLAEEHGVPPYVIFHDVTLRDMLERRPQTPGELLDVSGVGDSKLERFGADFLEVLQGNPEALEHAQ
ncbi:MULTISPECIES: DNA helicase RecQ [unclassified Marinimicrobium]|jgi:ATP-dependent DNA helicase RecQ|uniref:DNA helicase RecQ n=1 Tax=unclassified Marinimicrobium TaxID=2632100 RepID=UPI00257E1D95|nr:MULTISPECIES: DNA helicase RecQ [unclassified Marinimicrobium]|tara:strand:- start:202 stop:2025 length:1824 start_codon:yes stop_codon:yes gene_type:complete